MDANLVSVIIPVYNTEEFIEEAVRSIIAQTLQNLEIIIINDGSTDNSLNIVRQLAKKDNRIQVHTQENQGQSITRNKGIEYAKGKFIYFMDSDDYLEPEALEYCWKKCEELQLDFVTFDGDILNKTNKYKHLDLKYKKEHILKNDQIIAGIDAFKILTQNNNYSPSPCLIFIRRRFLTNINLLFYPKIIHEDQLFTTLLYLQASRISTINKIFFRRRLRENSTMTNEFSMKNMNGYFTVTDQLIKFCESHPETKKIINLYLSKMLNAATWLAYKLPFNEKLNICTHIIFKYKAYVSTKNIFILLFKSFFKK